MRKSITFLDLYNGNWTGYFSTQKGKEKYILIDKYFLDGTKVIVCASVSGKKKRTFYEGRFDKFLTAQPYLQK